MKHLWIVRHAKSDWGDPGLPDFERPLNKRGLGNAPAMGKWLAGQGVVPELIISSPAVRARRTAEMLATGMGYPLERIQLERRIYEASPETLLDVLAQADAAVNRLMLVGHNPGLTLLVNMLGGGPLDNLPTCAVAALTFNSPDWSLLCHAPVQESLWLPREVLQG